MFTFSFGSAFAYSTVEYGYSWENPAMSLSEAKTDAIAFINAYSVDGLTAVSLAQAKADKLYYTEKINAATTVAEVSGLIDDKNSLDGVDSFVEAAKLWTKLTVLGDAMAAALTQAADYATLVNEAINGYSGATNLANVNWSAYNAIFTSAALVKVDAKALADLKNTEAVAKALYNFTEVEHKLGDIKWFEALQAAIISSTTVEEVKASLDEYLGIMDSAVLATVAAKSASDWTGLTDQEKLEWKNAVRQVASEEWRIDGDNTHSAAVKAQYSALVNEAVAALENIRTTRDIYDYVYKYGLKVNVPKALKNAIPQDVLDSKKASVYVDTVKGEIVIYRKTAGAFATLAAQTLAADAVKRLATEALAALGEYDWTKIAADKWDDAETFYDALETAKADGTVGGPTALASILDKASKLVTDAQYAEAVKDIVALYDQYTLMHKFVTNNWSASVHGVFDTELNDALNTSVYNPENAKAIQSYCVAYNYEILQAKDVKEIEAIYEKYYALIDAIPTEAEKLLAKKVAAFSDGLDYFVEGLKYQYPNAADIYVTELDQLVNELKGTAKNLIGDYGTELIGENPDGSYYLNLNCKVAEVTNFADYGYEDKDVTLKEVLTNVVDSYDKDGCCNDVLIGLWLNYNSGYNSDSLVASEANKRGFYNGVGAFPVGERDAVNYPDRFVAVTQMEGNYAAVTGFLKNIGFDGETMWYAYFAKRDALLEGLSKFTPDSVLAYNVYLDEYNKAVEKLANPELKASYEAKLEAAGKALFRVMYAYHKVSVDKLTAKVTKYDPQLFWDAAYKYNRLAYEDAIAPAGKTTGSAYKDFVEIAHDFALTAQYVTTNYYPAAVYLSDADQIVAANIIADTYAAIEKAKTKAEVEALAEDAIAKLDALAYVALPTHDGTVIALPTVLAHAQQYFMVWYNAMFSSDATAYLALAKDIAQAQEDILGAPAKAAAEAAAKAARIEAVEALKVVKNSSKAGKGYITISWSVKGDASVADGYQVYRSTKLNSGYGTKPFYTTKSYTKMTYKNTKDLKKGTRYYYKVRAYAVIDGVTYYSDWSNKAYRVAK